MSVGRGAVFSQRRVSVDRELFGRQRRVRNWLGAHRAAAECFFSDKPLEEGRRVRIRELRLLLVPLARRQAAPAARACAWPSLPQPCATRPAPAGRSTISLSLTIHPIAGALWPRLPMADSRSSNRSLDRNLVSAVLGGQTTVLDPLLSSAL